MAYKMDRNANEAFFTQIIVLNETNSYEVVLDFT
jgi:hypothetical protein